MKIKADSLFPIMLLVMIPVVYIASWVGSLYNPQVCSLLSDDGIRWTVSHPIANFSTVPLGSILVLMMTISVLIESGLFELVRGRTSLKQRRAIIITSCVMVFVAVIIGMMLFLADAVIVSPLGTFADSALARGGIGVLMVFFIILGNVYGFASGRFVTTRDFIYAHRKLLTECASYFIALFLSAQLVCSLEYSNLPFFSSSPFLLVLKLLLYYVPLVGVIVRSVRRML